MKLSTKGRYGLRALVDLAINSRDEAASTGSIAQRQGISERYLEQLMAKLKRAGIITGIRGAQGGYVLARRAEDITIGDVLRSLWKGDLNAVDCPAAMDSGECSGSEQCAAKDGLEKNQRCDQPDGEFHPLKRSAAATGRDSVRIRKTEP